MLSLVFALIVAEPAVATQPVAAAEPPARVVKVSKMDAVTCKYVVTKSGAARQFCLTNREWRDHQIERQQRLNEFTRRQLQYNITH